MITKYCINCINRQALDLLLAHVAVSCFLCTQEMAKILNHPRVYSFLHVPVQSGSDAVLGDMKREYCRADFMHVVDFLKERYY